MKTKDMVKKPIIRMAEGLTTHECLALLRLALNEKMRIYGGLTRDTDFCYSFDTWDVIEDKLRTVLLNNEGVKP